MLSTLLTALMPAPGDGHTDEEHAAQGARAHECLRYMSSGVGISRGAGSSDFNVSRLFFFASHGADSSSIHSKASSCIKALDVLGGAFVRGIEHIPRRAVFQLDRAKLRFVRHSKLHAHRQAYKSRGCTPSRRRSKLSLSVLGQPTKGWTGEESVRILFSWSRRRKRAIGGYASAISPRMK